MTMVAVVACGIGRYHSILPLSSGCVQVVIPLYHAAFRYSTTKLLANCTNFLLNHYKEVSDPGEYM